MKVVIAGSRSFLSEHTIALVDYAVAMSGYTITEEVCGLAKGIDTFGKKWAELSNIPVKEFPANWDQHGKAAGPIRNGEMADYADAAIIIWDGESRGSQDMMKQMKKRGKLCYILAIKGNHA